MPWLTKNSCWLLRSPGFPHWSSTSELDFSTNLALCLISSAPSVGFRATKLPWPESSARPRPASPLPIIASEIYAPLRSNSWPAFLNRRVKMRILYCNKYDYPFSGTEVYLFDLINRLETRGHETALFIMDHGHTPAFEGRSYRIPYINFKDQNAGFVKKVRMA